MPPPLAPPDASPDTPPRCPPDGHAWVRGAGALGENVCTTCQRRFFAPDVARALLGDVLGLREDVLRELSREGARQVPCPACATQMTTTRVRGVWIELCGGCGSTLLDPGELLRISQAMIAEFPVSAAAEAPGVEAPGAEADSIHLDRVRAAMAGSLELDLRGRAPRGARIAAIEVEVRCTQCDAPLDLAQVNWLVNTRPWCGPCARPYASLLAPLWQALRTLLEPRKPFWRRGAWARDERPRRVDVLRIAPADAERYFEPFFTLRRLPASAGDPSPGATDEQRP